MSSIYAQPWTCEGCRFYKPEGWAMFSSKGGPIHEGPCWHYTFYSLAGAKRACNGRLKEPIADTKVTDDRG